MNSLCQAWPYSERLLVTVCASTLHAAMLYASCAVFVAADRFGFWERYRLPRNRPDLKPDTEHNVQLNRRAFWEQLVGTLVVVPVALYFAAPLLQSRIAVCTPLPAPRDLAVETWLMIVGCDTCFYWVPDGPDVDNERIIRFEFPEHFGALDSFLKAISKDRHGLTMLHYRNHGGQVGKVLAGVSVAQEKLDQFTHMLEQLGHTYYDETENPVYTDFMRGQRSS